MINSDKYVSRTEFNELKARLDHLESIVARGFPTATPIPAAGPPVYPISGPQQQAEAGSSSSSLGYPQMLPQPPEYSQRLGTSVQPQQPPQTPLRYGNLSQISTSMHPVTPGSPAHTRQHPQSPTTPYTQRPYSRSALASPYDQAKKSQAQTPLSLGTRLRLLVDGSAARSSSIKAARSSSSGMLQIVEAWLFQIRIRCRDICPSTI